MTKPFCFFLIDDDRDDVSLFEEILQEIDPTIIFHSAPNGLDALEKLRGGSVVPDLIFLDLNMPMMDGKECLEELKKDEQFKSIPVIMFTTSSHSSDIEQTLQMGATCFITKPTSMLELRHILSSIAESLPHNLSKALYHLSINANTFIVC